ncbi:DUF1036 domain-containing protein [Tychonema sp. LEGE 07203]|uniref:DUF1036 domain-containing protein n=1 Tax=Tychonema sp. LEGE 07203 TaxID=1828671 RepID=UPI0018813081|nr:DUF1036 domain-containing protein [Tychonema sp. LEGE 07203]MBE9092897.1 DUF1036 domain-containing protein [Tychonema sp. LEGE 07203]
MFKNIVSLIFGSSTTLLISSSTFLALTFSFPSAAHAWFTVCNKSTQKVSVAFAYLDINARKPDIFGNAPPQRSRGWTSEGWWSLSSGECAQVYPHELRVRNSVYYVYAKGEDGGLWGGDHNFCTIREAFTIGLADQRCGGRGEFKGFVEVNTGNARNFTYNLTE